MSGHKIVEGPPFFDDEEREFIEEVEARAEAGLLVNVLTPERKAEFEEMARNTLEAMNHEVSIDFPGADFCKLGDQARELGTTQEALIASIVHQYVEGRLVEKE